MFIIHLECSCSTCSPAELDTRSAYPLKTVWIVLNKNDKQQLTFTLWYCNTDFLLNKYKWHLLLKWFLLGLEYCLSKKVECGLLSLYFIHRLYILVIFIAWIFSLMIYVYNIYVYIFFNSFEFHIGDKYWQFIAELLVVTVSLHYSECAIFDNYFFISVNTFLREFYWYRLFPCTRHRSAIVRSRYVLQY